MLGAVAVLVDSAVCDLATAVRLVTSGPAETVGLTDRGAIEVGLRADLVLARFDGSLATVESVLRAEDGLRGEERSLELQTA
jgi:alpha-D-ribose 1-methylphosphonate 5-triphosphate diphosphatase